MSYLKYSNLCADMVRAALKDAAKTKAKAREVIYFRSAVWKNGVPEKQGEGKAGVVCGAAAGRLHPPQSTGWVAGGAATAVQAGRLGQLYA